jgi:predicted ATP-dependent endonuclease of OLD family
MSVIIGENDCGKTSIMFALQAFFDNKKMSDSCDYFKKCTNEPIEIEIHFSEINQDAIEYSDDNMLKVKRTFRLDESPLTEIWQNGSWNKAVATKINKCLPDFVLVPVDRDLKTHGKMTEKSLFGMLFRPLIKQIVGEKASSLTNELQKTIRFGIEQRMSDLQAALTEQLNNNSIKLNHEIDIDILKGIDIPIDVSDERVQNIPIENRGAGIQSNFILALFRVYAKYKTEDFIMAIEEPENSLHPRAQREMRWAMQDFSRSSQVICTTHSPVFLDLGRLEDNIILRRKDDGATLSSFFNIDDPNELRELVGIKVSDALLGGGGNCTLIVEGDTELHAYPHLFQCIGVNPRRLGISIVNANGSDVEKMLMHSKVMKAYKLPCLIVVDKNKAKEAAVIEARKQSNVKLVHSLSKGNFEEYLPLEILLEVVNELCRNELSEVNFGDDVFISIAEIDRSKPVENQICRLVHEKFTGVRFGHLKVHIGQEVGRRMVERKIPPDDEIKSILLKAIEIAEGD